MNLLTSKNIFDVKSKQIEVKNRMTKYDYHDTYVYDYLLSQYETRRYLTFCVDIHDYVFLFIDYVILPQLDFN